MHYVAVQIVRFVDSVFPGWVECELVDASGRRHIFNDKAPMFTAEMLDADSKYPAPGDIYCEVLELYQDENVGNWRASQRHAHSIESLPKVCPSLPFQRI